MIKETLLGGKEEGIEIQFNDGGSYFPLTQNFAARYRDVSSLLNNERGLLLRIIFKDNNKTQ
jgi:hypothetical protein